MCAECQPSVERPSLLSPNLQGLCIRRVRVQTVVERCLSLALPLWQAPGGMPTVFSNADQAPSVCLQPDCCVGGGEAVIDFLSSA